MKEDIGTHSEPLNASRKQRRKALTSVKHKHKLVSKVVASRFKHLAIAANEENVEMSDENIALFMEDKAEQYPLTQAAFKQFAEARRALTFLAVSEKSLRDMPGLPQYTKDGVQTQNKTDDISI
jgi:hypothetical protein